MFEFSTIWIPSTDIYESTVHEENDVTSDDCYVNNNIISDQELPSVLFTDIPFVEETIGVFVTVGLGFVLNLVILRCFWSTKSSAAVYIRVLAYYDMCVLASWAFDFVSIYALSVPKWEAVLITAKFLKRLVSSLSIVGPLFLALDRFLVVTSPHKFQNYTNSMRKAKGGILVVTLVTNILAQLSVLVLGFESLVTPVLTGILTFVYITQFLTCVVLYGIVFVKMVQSERKMANHRHIGNRWRTLYYPLRLADAILYIKLQSLTWASAKIFPRRGKQNIENTYVYILLCCKISSIYECIVISKTIHKLNINNGDNYFFTS